MKVVKPPLLWGRTGFDLGSYAGLQAEDDGWPLKKTVKNIYANSNIDMDMAPSVAEADEILAKFGYVEDTQESISAKWDSCRVTEKVPVHAAA